MMTRRYPIGIQTFSEIVRGGYVYVDKTDLVWQMTCYAKYVFLSRPRRFGKSLLTSTLDCYFRGERELFNGLKIMELEQKWEQYPVIHLDLSTAKGQYTSDGLRDTLMWVMRPLADTYGRKADETTPGKLLTGIIRRAYEQTGKQVVVIIDEYDAPLLEVLHEQETLDAMRQVMQEFYVPLKASEAMVKFCFITGITKFSQLSIFSTINNIKNVSLLPRFSAICGFTESEVKSVFVDDMERIAKAVDQTLDEVFLSLKDQYDGYHFASVSEDIYNPFSLLNALMDEELGSFWFASGTPSFLIRQLQHYGTDIASIECLEVPAAAFDQPTENMQDALPLLYQCGYLTIKGYDRESQMYQLSIPNREVRIGYSQGLLPVYTGLRFADVQSGFALKFWRALRNRDIDLAMREMKAYLSGVPYVEGFKQKLQGAASAEGFYEYTLYLIFTMLNSYVRTQAKMSKGRTDLVVWMPDTIYVFELKVNGTAQEALQQIDERGYAEPYMTDGRKVVKVGVKFNAETRVPDDWVIAS